MKKTIFSILFLMTVAVLSAAPLRNIPQTLIQPNGDTLRCFASGDEFFNYLHDADGYTIIQHPVTGYYVYATRDGENIQASNYIAGKIKPALLLIEKNTLPSSRKIREIITTKKQLMRVDQPAALSNMVNAPPSNAKNQGTLNNIVVFIRFSDDQDTPFSAFNIYDNICNAPNTSMKAYFEEASYGLISIPSVYYPEPNGSIVLSYKDSHPRNYYQKYNATTNPDGCPDNQADKAAREHLMIKNAIESVRGSIPTSLNIDMNNDGKVDNVSIIISGNSEGWNDLLWPHRWVLYSNSTSINGKAVYDYLFVPNGSFNVSTLCHETFHCLGAPDLYHYDDGGKNFTPVSSWDIMEANRTPPQHMSAYMKFKYGNWISSIPTLTTPGRYTLYPLNTSATRNCYKIPIVGSSNEYYVLEYRKKPSSGFESSLPGSGLLVYRINTTFSGNANYNGTTIFDEIYVFRPNGTTTNNGTVSNASFSSNVSRTVFDPETNPYPFLTSGTRDYSIYLSNISAAGDSISFDFTSVQTPVSSITINTQGPIMVGESTFLSATVLPANASNKTLLWSITNGTDKAHISGNNLIGDAEGNVTIKATAQDGSGVSATKTIAITARPVSTITITVPDNISLTKKNVPVTATVAPANATNKSLTWSVINQSGDASILSNSSLALNRTGYILLTATAQDNSGVTATKRVFITPDEENNVKAYWTNDTQLNIERSDGIGLLEIYSLQGNKIMDIPGSNNTALSVSFAGLPHGIYILRVWNGNKSKVSSEKIMW